MSNIGEECRVVVPGPRDQIAKGHKAAQQTAEASKYDGAILERVRAGALLSDVATELGISCHAARRSLRRSGFDVDLRSSNSGYGRR